MVLRRTETFPREAVAAGAGGAEASLGAGGAEPTGAAGCTHTLHGARVTRSARYTERALHGARVTRSTRYTERALVNVASHVEGGIMTYNVVYHLVYVE